MPSSTSFIFPSVPVDEGIPQRSLTLSWVGYVGRPLSDVEARSPITVSLISAFDASEDAVAFPIRFAGIPALRAGLAGVVRFDFLDGYAFPLGHVLQGISEEAVWDAVDFSSALLAPFVLMLSEVSKPLDGDVGVELLSEFNDFVGYLPHPRPNVVSLFPAETFEFETSFSLGTVIPIFLEFCPIFFKAELSGGNVFSKVGLLQHVVWADDGYGDFGTVDIHSHSVRSDGWFRRGFVEDDEEAEAPLHNDTGRYPTVFNMFLESAVCSVLADGKPYSGVVGSEAEDWVVSLGFFEAEEPSVEADDALLGLVLYSFSVVPCVACSLNHELAGYTVFAHKRPICISMKLPPTPDAVRSFEGLLHNPKKGLIGLLEETPLNLRWLKDIENEALLHVADPKENMLVSLNLLWSQFLPRLKPWASLRKEVKLRPPPTEMSNILPQDSTLSIAFCLLLIGEQALRI